MKYPAGGRGVLRPPGTPSKSGLFDILQRVGPPDFRNRALQAPKDRWFFSRSKAVKPVITLAVVWLLRLPQIAPSEVLRWALRRQLRNVRYGRSETVNQLLNHYAGATSAGHNV